MIVCNSASVLLVCMNSFTGRLDNIPLSAVWPEAAVIHRSSNLLYMMTHCVSHYLLRTLVMNERAGFPGNRHLTGTVSVESSTHTHTKSEGGFPAV